MDISKIIDGLHEKKITEILTLHFILKDCDSKMNMRQKRVLQTLMKDCFFQIPLSKQVLEEKQKDLQKSKEEKPNEADKNIEDDQ